METGTSTSASRFLKDNLNKSKLKNSLEEKVISSSNSSSSSPSSSSYSTGEIKTPSLKSVGSFIKDKDSSENSRKKLTPRIVLSEQDDLEIFSVRFSPDNRLFAAACGDGSAKIFSTNSGRLAYSLRTPGSNLPVACLRFRPTSAQHKTKNILITAASDGSLKHWHVTTEKCLHTIVEEGNQIFAVDYRKDAERFVTAGKDFKVRLYDESTKARISVLSGGQGEETAGHANRVFSLKFVPDNPNMLISGGWDSTIQIWDIRTNHSIRSIFGPHICGDALDITSDGSTIVSGSFRPNAALQLWDFSSGKLLESVNWPNSTKDSCLLYAAQFSRDPNSDYMIAAGCGMNEARLFERSTLKPVGEVTGFKKGIYALDMSGDGKMVGLGGAGSLGIYEL